MNFLLLFKIFLWWLRRILQFFTSWRYHKTWVAQSLELLLASHNLSLCYQEPSINAEGLLSIYEYHLLFWKMFLKLSSHLHMIRVPFKSKTSSTWSFDKSKSHFLLTREPLSWLWCQRLDFLSNKISLKKDFSAFLVYLKNFCVAHYEYHQESCLWLSELLVCPTCMRSYALRIYLVDLWFSDCILLSRFVYR